MCRQVCCQLAKLQVQKLGDAPPSNHSCLPSSARSNPLGKRYQDLSSRGGGPFSNPGASANKWCGQPGDPGDKGLLSPTLPHLLLLGSPSPTPTQFSLVVHSLPRDS